MSKTLVIYIAAVLWGVLMGWGFAVPIQDWADKAPSDNPALWMLAFGLGSPAVVWAFFFR